MGMGTKVAVSGPRDAHIAGIYAPSKSWEMPLMCVHVHVMAPGTVQPTVKSCEGETQVPNAKGDNPERKS